MTCRIETVDADPTLVTVAGEIDLAETGGLETALCEPVEQGHDVVVDMRQVSFIDCTGLRTLAQAERLARHRGRRIVVRPSAAVSRLLQLAERTRRM